MTRTYPIRGRFRGADRRFALRGKWVSGTGVSEGKVLPSGTPLGENGRNGELESNILDSDTP